MNVKIRIQKLQLLEPIFLINTFFWHENHLCMYVITQPILQEQDATQGQFLSNMAGLNSVLSLS